MSDSQFCAVHLQQNLQDLCNPGLVLDGETGLTQDMQDMGRDSSLPPGLTLPSQAIVPDHRTSALRNMVEEALLRNDVYLRAISPAGQVADAAMAETMLKSADLFIDTMKKLGFDFDSADPWQQLGLAKLEGPETTLEMILARAQLGRDLLQLAVAAPWGQACHGDLHSGLTKVEMAAASCEATLGEVLAERKKTRPGTWDRWMEGEPAFGAWLAAYLQRPDQPRKTWRVLTDLSNEYGVHRTAGSPTVSPLEARQYLKHLSGDVVRIADYMGTVSDEGWVLWAPATGQELTKLLAAYRKHLVKHQGGDHFRMILLLRHAPVARLPPQLLLDLWQSPAWDGKQEELVERITLLEEPVHCVISGAINPLCTAHTVALVHLGPGSRLAEPQWESWRPTWSLGSGSAYVIIDVPKHKALTIESKLFVHVGREVTRWEGPLPSPGSVKGADRVLFRGYLMSAETAEVDGRLLVRTLRRELGTDGVYCGTSALYGMGASMLAEMTHPAAAAYICDLSDELLFLDTRQALVLPRAAKEEWERALTDAATLEADRSIRQVRWRKSRNAARPWVRPLMLPDAARGAIARAKASKGQGQRGDGTVDPVVLLSVSGPTLGSAPDQLMEAILAKAADFLGVTLRKSTTDVVRTAYSWAPAKDADGAWAGRARLQLRTMAEAKLLHKAMHGVPVWLGTDWTTLAVTHAALPLAPSEHQHRQQPGGQ